MTFFRKTDTSKAAAQAIKPQASYIRAKVLESIIASGEDGMTSYQLSIKLRITYESVQPRTSELQDKGLIVDSGKRRSSRNPNRMAIVWVATQKSD